jgi:hypothetical protein
MQVSASMVNSSHIGGPHESRWASRSRFAKRKLMRGTNRGTSWLENPLVLVR